MAAEGRLRQAAKANISAVRSAGRGAAGTGLALVWALLLTIAPLPAAAQSPGSPSGQGSAPRPYAANADAWSKCPRVAKGLRRIERRNAHAISVRDMKALRDPARMCVAYTRMITASQSLLDAANDTRTAVESCASPRVPAKRKAQLTDLLQLQSGLVSDQLASLRAARQKNCPTP